jgi:hypothetical protein
MDMSNTAANLAAGFAASQIGATAAAITGKSVTDLAATSVVIAQGSIGTPLLKNCIIPPFQGNKTNVWLGIFLHGFFGLFY